MRSSDRFTQITIPSGTSKGPPSPGGSSPPSHIIQKRGLFSENTEASALSKRIFTPTQAWHFIGWHGTTVASALNNKSESLHTDTSPQAQGNAWNAADGVVTPLPPGDVTEGLKLGQGLYVASKHEP
jgi:hypothetical protein